MALYPHMSVADNLAFGLRRRSVPRAEIERRVTAVADTLGLSGLLDSQRTWLATYGLTPRCSLVKKHRRKEGAKNVSLVLAFSCGFWKWLSLIKSDPANQGPPNFQFPKRIDRDVGTRSDATGWSHRLSPRRYKLPVWELGVGGWELTCPL